MRYSHWGFHLAGRGTFAKVTRGAAAAALLLACVGCDPGAVAYREGHKAELRKDYDTAVIDFDKALQYEPENPRYLIHEKQSRLQGGYYHVAQGNKLLSEGRTGEAIGEFQRAVGIDPTNQSARQQLDKLLTTQAKDQQARQKALQEALKPKQEPEVPIGVQLKPFPAEPLAHFRIAADSRKVFETLGKLAELNVTFNYDFQPRPLSLDLSNVKLEDALQAAAYEAHVFWKAITPNTILIVPDTPTNRREYEDEVLKTYHLSNPLAPADRTQISTALKQVLGLQRIIDNPASNSIIIRDTPDKVKAAEELIKSLDLGKAEILIDVTVLEADLSRMRTLGLIPITNLAITPTPAASSTTGTTGIPTTLVPLNHPQFNQDYSLVLPSSAAEALLSDTRTHILQNPEVRVTDGLTAKLRIGSRVPFATGSFLPSFGGTTGTAGGGVSLLASTQFQYQDVGVNLDITPHLTATGEISLHAKIEISSVGASVSLGGLNEPTFNQRVIEHDIQLSEGEVSLLGGLIDTETTRTVTGLPGLSDLPFLKYLFSTEQKNVMDTEVFVMLNPHIIRLPEVAPAGVTAVSESGAAPLLAIPGLPPR